VRQEGLGQLEKSNDPIRNRTRELPAYSIVPEPTMLLRAPAYLILKNERSLMRFPCCLCLYVYPPSVAMQRLGKHVPAAMNTRTAEELLDASVGLCILLLLVTAQKRCCRGCQRKEGD
jgi:hypothetical protein